MKKALFFDKEPGGEVRCHLCPRECRILPGKTGFCTVRKNIDGELYSLNYGRLLAMNVDPIEKKPLYHFHPGSTVLSIGTFGCNQRCDCCQNSSMIVLPEEEHQTVGLSAPALADNAGLEGSIGVAYTYNEPTVWYEYVADCAAAVRERGFLNILVTNGQINPGPLSRLLPYIDAMNIDLKSMDAGFYKTICNGELEPVLETIRLASEACHVEVTNLLIPTLNDSEEQIRELVGFVAGISREIPVHFSAYHPCYRMRIPPTSPESLRRAAAIAGEHLDFVYLGNIRDTDGSTSFCPGCGEELVWRNGYSTEVRGLRENACSRCGKRLPFIV